jgi:YidC/Oxa1 family membrane protein insertase
LDQQTRHILFIVLSVGILFGSMYFMPQPPPATAPSASVSQKQDSSSGSSKASEASRTSRSASATSVKAAPQRKILTAAVASVTVETDDYIATFSSQGGVLTGFELKKFKDRHTQKPIQMVNDDPSRPKPFSITYAPLADLNRATFEVEGTSKKLSKPNDKAKLLFRFVDEKGTVLEKSFSFKNGSYLIDFDITVNQTGHGSVPTSELVVEWADTLGKEENTGMGGFGSAVQNGYRVATLTLDNLESQTAKKSQEEWKSAPNVTWTALANQFFVAAMVPDSSTGGAYVKVIRDLNAYKAPSAESTPVPSTSDAPPELDLKMFNPRPLLVFSGQALRSGESFHRGGKVFMGPQNYELLQDQNLQLEKIVDFGFFGIISVQMLRLLKWFYTLGHSWGLAIILLSIVVKLVLWWPTHNSYKNMYLLQQKTREIQPKLDAIKKKYANDKQEQQKQTMALYSQAGLNPMGGCLPMLLQLPVFYALYSTLSHSIELRGASFLWLHDLTLKDPFIVLPLLMGASMIAQQKVSGQMSTQTAGQQKVMMWMMPVVLTFFSIQWPAGLLVYWVVTNVLSILQQKIVNREIQNAKKKEEVVKS